jgi:putative oxidoreductase
MRKVGATFGGFGRVADALASWKGFVVQRLFSTFANGWPGTGLLLLRLLTTGLLWYGTAHLIEPSRFASAVPHIFEIGAGVLFLVGLWTPVVGTLVAVVEVGIVCLRAGDPFVPLIVAALGATVAMVGPGAWSIDARLFGRKHIEIPER